MNYALPFDNCSVKPYPKGSVMQFFGENISLYSTVCPIVGQCMTGGHNGWDLVDAWGTPIKAVSPYGEKVVDVKNSPKGYGKHVRTIDGTYEFTYGHLSSISCKIGDTLKQGEYFAKMGNTGFVISGASPYWKANPYAGTHLHFTLRKYATDKTDFQYPTGDRVRILNYNNGTFGALDPMGIFTDVNDEEVRRLSLTVISLANQVIGLLQAIIKLKQ